MRDLGDYRECRNHFFATTTPLAAPAVTLVEVSRLYGQEVEIQREVIGALTTGKPACIHRTLVAYNGHDRSEGIAGVFSLQEVEAARDMVHEAFPGTPQYTWPLLTERVGAEVWV